MNFLSSKVSKGLTTVGRRLSNPSPTNSRRNSRETPSPVQPPPPTKSRRNSGEKTPSVQPPPSATMARQGSSALVDFDLGIAPPTVRERRGSQQRRNSNQQMPRKNSNQQVNQQMPRKNSNQQMPRKNSNQQVNQQMPRKNSNPQMPRNSESQQMPRKNSNQQMPRNINQQMPNTNNQQMPKSSNQQIPSDSSSPPNTRKSIEELGISAMTSGRPQPPGTRKPSDLLQRKKHIFQKEQNKIVDSAASVPVAQESKKSSFFSTAKARISANIGTLQPIKLKKVDPSTLEPSQSSVKTTGRLSTLFEKKREKFMVKYLLCKMNVDDLDEIIGQCQERKAKLEGRNPNQSTVAA